MPTMDPVTAQEHAFPDHGNQRCSIPRAEISTAGQIVEDKGRSDFQESAREPSKIRLAVVLGGLWVGTQSVSLGKLSS